ncbi:MAG: hypothetical protein AB1757_04885 [Acidobacteriota bacterium]
MNERIKKRKKVIAVLAIITFLLSISALWTYTTRWTVEKVEKIIKKETPLGSSKESVDALLTKYNFEFSSYVEALDSGNFDDKPNTLKGIAKGYISGFKKNVGWSLLIRWDIAVRFYFNEKGELIDHTVRKIGTAP